METVMIACISDELSGELVECCRWSDLDLDTYLNTSEDEDAGYFGDVTIQVFEMPAELEDELNNYQGHPSHFLSQKAVEMCLGDFL